MPQSLTSVTPPGHLTPGSHLSSVRVYLRQQM